MYLKYALAPSAIRPNPASGPDVGRLMNRLMSVSVMPCLGSQSAGQFFGSSSKPEVPLYTPSISPTPDGGGLLLPGSTCSAPLEPAAVDGVLPVAVFEPAVVAVAAAAVVAVAAAAVVAAASVVAAPAVVGAAVVFDDLSSLPHAASRNDALIPTANAVLQRALLTVSPQLCGRRSPTPPVFLARPRLRTNPWRRSGGESGTTPL